MGPSGAFKSRHLRLMRLLCSKTTCGPDTISVRAGEDHRQVGLDFPALCPPLAALMKLLPKSLGRTTHVSLLLHDEKGRPPLTLPGHQLPLGRLEETLFPRLCRPVASDSKLLRKRTSFAVQGSRADGVGKAVCMKSASVDLPSTVRCCARLGASDDTAGPLPDARRVSSWHHSTKGGVGGE